MARLSMQGLRRKFERKMRASAANSALTAIAAPTGTATRTTFATYTAPTVSVTYLATDIQNAANHVQILSERLKALIDDLHTRGIIV